MSKRTTASIESRLDFGVISLDAWMRLPIHPQLESEPASAGLCKPNCSLSSAVTIGDVQGDRVRLDGAQRANLWNVNRSDAPATLLTTIYNADSERDLAASVAGIYGASRTIAEQRAICEVMAQCSMPLSSHMLSKGYLSVALNIASRGTPASEQVDCAPLNVAAAAHYFRDALHLLDGINPQPSVFYSGVVAAALLALSTNPDQIEFFERLNNRTGVTDADRRDPVAAVLEHIDSLADDSEFRRFDSIQPDLCGRTLRGFKAWRNRHGKDDHFWFHYKIRALPVVPAIIQQRSINHTPDEQ